MAKRPQGSGSLFLRTDERGVESWYGEWRVDGRLVKKRLGPRRRPSSADGFGKTEAEG